MNTTARTFVLSGVAVAFAGLSLFLAALTSLPPAVFLISFIAPMLVAANHLGRVRA